MFYCESFDDVLLQRAHDVAVVEVEARDKGFPMRSAVTRIEVEIIRGSNPSPQWVEDYSLVPVLISENTPVNTVVKQLRAISPLPHSPVHYVIQQSELLEQSGQSRSFYIRVDQGTNEMSLLTYKTLDYEELPQYILTIKASVSEMCNCAYPLKCKSGLTKSSIMRLLLCSFQMKSTSRVTFLMQAFCFCDILSCLVTSMSDFCIMLDSSCMNQFIQKNCQYAIFQCAFYANCAMCLTVLLIVCEFDAYLSEPVLYLVNQSQYI